MNLPGTIDAMRAAQLERGVGHLTPEEVEAGWHFCPDWDGMLIHPNSPEGACCLCDRSGG